MNNDVTPPDGAPDPNPVGLPAAAPGAGAGGTPVGDSADSGWWRPRPSGEPAGWAAPQAVAGAVPGGYSTGGTPGGYPTGGDGSSRYGAPWTGSYYAASGPTGGATAGGVATAEAEPPRPAHRGRRVTLIAATTVAFALVAGFGAGALGARLTSGTSTAAAGHSLTQLTTAPVSASRTVPADGSVEQVAASLLPTVVSILSTSSSSSGEGSGIILSADGLILTNNHVIDGATSLKVQFNDGTSAEAKVVGADSTDDLAVIKASGVSGLTPATLGTSADLKIGQSVVAVGSPLGLSATVTSGIVSALNRPVRTSSAEEQQTPDQGQSQDPFQGQGQSQSSTGTSQDTVMNAVQTDAAINPGNSGGPLVDMTGKVIGINSAIASLSSSSSSSQSGSIGVGFAIPIDQAKRIAQEIIDTGHATHALLGATVSDATDGANSLLTVGAKIGEITAGSGAEKAGLKAGDVITKVGDQHVDSGDALVAAIRSAAPNGTVNITYTRGTVSDTVSVTLGSATAN
jgi:putative serine protease PepD